MSVAKITEKLASRLLVGQTVWDESVKGFGIRKQSKAAVFVFKYRQGGRQRFKTIGRHGSPWTTEMARLAAKRYLLALIDGRDIVGGADNSSPSFAQFADRYLTQHAASRKKPRTLAEDRRNLDCYILPSFGNLRLKQITRRDVAAFHGAQHTRPVTGNRCLSLISHIFTIAEKWEMRPESSNPCRGLDRYPERRRERWLDSEELRRLGDALDRYERTGGLEGHKTFSWRAVACIRLLILTGARVGEVLGLQWSWINWDRGFARLPDSKTGPKNIQLPRPALDLLAAIRHHQPGEKFVLPSCRTNMHIQTIQKPWNRIIRLAGLPGVRIHDLRHCYASFAVAGGESLYMVGAILGHRTITTTQRYAHLANDSIAQAAGRTAGRLAQLLGPRLPGPPGQASDDHPATKIVQHNHLARPPQL
jgi:integrase